MEPAEGTSVVNLQEREIWWAWLSLIYGDCAALIQRIFSIAFPCGGRPIP